MGVDAGTTLTNPVLAGTGNPDVDVCHVAAIFEQDDSQGLKCFRLRVI